MGEHWLPALLTMCGLLLSALTFFLGRITSARQEGEVTGATNTRVGKLELELERVRGDARTTSAVISDHARTLAEHAKELAVHKEILRGMDRRIQQIAVDVRALLVIRGSQHASAPMMTSHELSSIEDEATPG